MFFYNVRNFRISNLTVKDPANYAIMVDTGAYFTMENLTFDFNNGNPTDTVRIEKDAAVDGLLLRDVTVEDHAGGRCRGLVNYGTVRHLQAEGLRESLIRKEGTMG
ncbi:MAG: hypothetical protein J6B24_02710 [Clostridia bacterium]|nr:hypothetical protein [Clostridia bacterium]